MISAGWGGRRGRSTEEPQIQLVDKMAANEIISKCDQIKSNNMVKIS